MRTQPTTSVEFEIGDEVLVKSADNAYYGKTGTVKFPENGLVTVRLHNQQGTLVSFYPHELVVTWWLPDYGTDQDANRRATYAPIPARDREALNESPAPGQGHAQGGSDA